MGKAIEKELTAAEQKVEAAEQGEKELKQDEKTAGVTLEDILAKMTQMEKENEEIRTELREAKEETAAAKKTAAAAKKEQELTEGQKQVLMERKFHETMEEAKKDKVKIRLPMDTRGEDDEVFVSVNGYRYQIKRGEEVEVPRFVAEVLANSEKQKLETYKYLKGLQEKAEKK